MLGAAIAILLLALSPSAASAPASGCKTRLTGGESCVKVVGHGRYVSTVTTGVRLRPRASWAGVFFTTWPPAAYRYTSGGSFWNESCELADLLGADHHARPLLRQRHADLR